MKSDPLERRRRSAGKEKRAGIGLAGAGASALVFLPATITVVWLSAAAQTPGPSSGLITLSIAAIVAVILLNSVFNAAVTAVDVLQSMHVKAINDTKGQNRLEELIEGKGLFAASSEIGSQTMRAWMIILCFVPAVPFSTWLEASVGFAGIGALLAAAAIIAIPAAAVNLLIGELIPKNYALTHPIRTTLSLYGFIKVTGMVFGIPARLLPLAAGIITKRFGANPTFAIANRAEEEIKTLVESYEESGEIEEEEADLLDNVFEFGDTVAREVMTPRVDVTRVAIDESLRNAAKEAVESGHSRLPVYEENEDQIVGIVHAKDILKAIVTESSSVGLADLLRPAMAVPENKALHDLLKDMQATRTQMVVVQDEFGGTAGIVTIEDIVEEVFGEIIDEYDEDEPHIIRTGDGFVVGGKMHLDDINDELELGLESDEFDTIGGYVFGLFGRQPETGEQIEDQTLRFEVKETDGRRIQLVSVEVLEPEEDESSSA